MMNYNGVVRSGRGADAKSLAARPVAPPRARTREKAGSERGGETYRRALEAELWNLTTGLGNTESFEVPAAVVDEMETSTLAHEHHVALDTRSRKAVMLAEVNDALKRLRSGGYGLCEECREPIPAGRLKALPWARLCLKCQEEQEIDNEPSLTVAGE
jgi:DnaK suppressor protein